MKTSWGFPVFQADDIMKVEPTKVHLVSHIMQGFVLNGLYPIVKILYFYRIHN